MKRGVLIIGILVVLSFLVVASVDIENSEIVNSYEIGDNVEGIITLSIDEESSISEVRSVFSGDETGSIELLELLQKHDNLDFTCDPSTCDSSYETIGSFVSSKTINLVNKKTLGIIVSGDDVDVKSFTFDLSSNSGESCGNQLAIDLTDDNKINWENNNALITACGVDQTSSCYQQGSFNDWARLDQVPYCEKIVLSKAPAFEVNAFIRADNGASFETDILKASLYNNKNEKVGECNLKKPSETGSKEFCTINYVAKENQDYFACVSLKGGVSIPITEPAYWVQARLTGEEKCGIFGDPSEATAFVGDYNIKAHSKKYASVGSLTFDQTLFNEQNQDSIVAYINDYLDEIYQGSCPNSGCVIPITFSGINQELVLSNILVDYSSSSASLISTTKIIEIETTPARINSMNTTIDLSLAGFSVPNNVSDYELELFIGNELITSRNISVLQKQPPFIEQIYPKIISAGNPTTFTAFIDSDVNLSGISFEWDFGDNSTIITTSTNKIQHTYNKVGSFVLKVTSKNGLIELGTLNFNVLVITPIEAINATLADLNDKLKELEDDINSLPEEYQEIVIERGIDIGSLKTSVKSIEDNYNFLIIGTNTQDNDYVNLILELNLIEIPESIGPSKTADLPLAFDVNDIILDDVVDLFNEFYISGKEDEYENAIVFWYLDNINANLKQKSYTINYDSYKEDLITEFELQINPRGSQTGTAYLIIEQDKDEIIFSENYDLFDESGVTGIELDLSRTNNIKFAIEGNINVFGITMYIVPELSVLGIRESIFIPSGPGFFPRFLVGTIIALIVTLGIYIFLQEWYKRNYEKYLFKNKNNLYNLLYFIKNAKTKGMKESVIVSKLRKSKWRKEQIIYAMKKFKGQRVGMWEIPIFKVFERKKMEKELQKRKRISQL